MRRETRGNKERPGGIYDEFYGIDHRGVSSMSQKELQRLQNECLNNQAHVPCVRTEGGIVPIDESMSNLVR